MLISKLPPGAIVDTEGITLTLASAAWAVVAIIPPVGIVVPKFGVDVPEELEHPDNSRVALTQKQNTPNGIHLLVNFFILQSPFIFTF
jgi:hypothetical protein